jgi:hypothetical protein
MVASVRASRDHLEEAVRTRSEALGQRREESTEPDEARRPPGRR